MTPASRPRRTATWFAVPMIATLAGCHGGAKIARLATTPNRPQSALASAGRAALLPATVALDLPSEMSSIEPSAASAGSTEPAPGPNDPATASSLVTTPAPSPPPGPPVPTPLLDAALVRANDVADIVVAEMARSPEPPRPAHDLPTLAPASIPAHVEPAPAPVAGPPAPAPTVAPAPVPEPTRPEEAWREGIQKLVGLARARLDQPGTADGPWGLRARVLAWLAEPDIDPDLGQRDGVRSVLRVLDDGPAPSHSRGDEVRAAVQVLEDKAPLDLVDLRLCSKVESYGEFEAYDPPVRKAGQLVVIYCEVDGLRHEATSAGFRSRLVGRVEIVPEGGGPPAFAQTLGAAEETCRRRRRDYYIAYRLVLPRSLPPGEYKLRLTEKDLLADRTATREVGFAIARD